MDKSSGSSSRNNGSASSDDHNNSSDSHTKKRKVWRTVNVSAGGGPPQTMTPEAAAKYIQQATASRGREVKISFGPSRPPSGSGSAQSGNITTATATAASVSFGSLDLQALKESAVTAAAAKPHKSSSANSASSKMKDGLPCSEAEMKALMSMFVEIMGMSMDTDKLDKSTPSSSHQSGSGSKKKSGSTMSGNPVPSNSSTAPVFMFGNTNGIPPPPGGFADVASWEALRRTYVDAEEDDDDEEDDDNDDDNSLPDLEDTAASGKSQEQFGSSSNQQQRAESNKVTGTKGKSPTAWESSEQDDELESEDRGRKGAAKKREKKNRKKLKAKEEAAQKAAEAAQKKREKSILSWRSRVVSACQSNEIAKLEALLQESPLRKQQNQNYSQSLEALGASTSSISEQDNPNEGQLTRSLIAPHLEFLLPNSIAKSRAQLNRGQEARELLASYILSSDIPIAFTPLRNGRTALHMACFLGDVHFVQLVLDKVATYEDSDCLLPESYLNSTCEDSGWSPLHYAALSGSLAVLEALLCGGCKVDTVTDDTHTWRISDGRGITPRELAQIVHFGHHENIIESHGVALQEMTSTSCATHADRRSFFKSLEQMARRLLDVESNGYTPLDYDHTIGIAGSDDGNESQSSQGIQLDRSRQQEDLASNKKKKKKKKNQKQEAEDPCEAEVSNVGERSVDLSRQTTPVIPQKNEEDPMVTLLLGMGFNEDQIMAAAKACGGTNRATADDLVAWIFGQDAQGASDGPDEQGGLNDEKGDEFGFEVNEVTGAKAGTSVGDASMPEESSMTKKEAEEAARRLAAKREETRRRNREWNNREQARQREEAKAKVAKAMTPPPRQPAAIPVAAPTLASPAYTGLQTGLPNGLTSGGIPNGIHTGLRTGLQSGLPAVMSGQFPGHMGPPPPRPVQQPVPVAPISIMAKPHAPIMMSNPMPPQMHQMMGPGHMLPMQQHIFPGAPYIAPEQRMMAPTSNNPYGFPPIGDDDRTVSSYGSGRSRTLSVSSASLMPPGGIPPPGFRPGLAGPAPSARPPPPAKYFSPPEEETPVPSFEPDANPLGEIRATAKAFVPANFNPRVVPTQVPPSSNKTNLLPFSGGHPQQFNPNLRSYDPTTGLPSGMILSGAPTAPTSLLPSGLSSMAYDRMTTVVTPLSEDFAPVVPSSTASSVTTGTTNDSIKVPGAARLSTGGDLGGSLLDSLGHGRPMMGGSSIWGGSGNDDIHSVPSLSGLPSFSFGDGGLNSSRETSRVHSSGSATRDFPGIPHGDNSNSAPGLGGWFGGGLSGTGTSGTGANATKGQGSIW